MSVGQPRSPAVTLPPPAYSSIIPSGRTNVASGKRFGLIIDTDQKRRNRNMALGIERKGSV